jgi:LysR family transcriptional regulator, glycine cleavage system transcriptional activator
MIHSHANRCECDYSVVAIPSRLKRYFRIQCIPLWNAKRPAMRRYDLPPLDLLETFEAAGRHLSFTRAGDELALTQSAVSRQIAALEERLGVALFQRLHRALRLTEAGLRLHRAAGEVLQRLHAVTGELRQSQRQKAVIVTTTPGFAGLWLIPRLAEFVALHPEVDVRTSASYALVNLDRDGFDLAIRYCASETAGPAAVKLFGESIMPVCSPALRNDPKRPLKRPEDLARHVLLHSESSDGGSMPLEWPIWLRAMKVEGLKPAGVLHFSLYDQMIHAAIDGQGVALGRLPLVSRLIREGRLIAPFPKRIASPLGYHLLRSAASAVKPEVVQFADWLIAQSREETRQAKA